MELTPRRLRAAALLALCAGLTLVSAPVVSAQSVTIWPASATPQSMDGDTSAVELGVRFRSDVDGRITGIRFYKYASNTGTHIGNLWTNGGTRLATATFAGETSSGWQQVTFATPVPITAGTTYVASYHTSVGRYGASDRYFATTGYDRAPLHALQDGAGSPNGVYRYGSTSAFPDQTYQSANYWVDVVFTATLGSDITPPIVHSVTPTGGTVSTSTPVGVTFNEMMASTSINTSTFELRDAGGGSIAGSIYPGGETPTATLTPSAPLTPGTTYTATVKGGAGGVTDLAGNALVASHSWSFTTAGAPPPPPGACPCSIWSAATTPPSGEPDTSAVEVGVRFRSDVNGYITGLRFYKDVANTGFHIGNLWTTTGALLARAVFTGESVAGWQQVTLSTPVAIAANTTYVASYHTSTGRYAASGGYFATGVDRAPLHALRDGVDGPNGVYRYGTASSFPDQTYHSANYWVDVVFNTIVAPVPLTIGAVSPSAGDAGVGTSSYVTASFNAMMASAAVNTTTFELRDPAGVLVPASVHIGGEAPNTIWLDPTPALANSTTYTATVKGGSTGVKDEAGRTLAANYTWSFTTAAAPPAPGVCPCSIWTGPVTPAGPDSDSSPVQLGVKFQSNAAGYITALRFYKHAANTGVHVGELWTRTGTRLANVTFTGETAAGWQQANLSTPVPIAAGTTYIASYHTDVGYYAANGSYFSAAVNNPPLRALADGEDGGNGVYRYGPAGIFPQETYHAANYWIDVVYTAILPDTTAPIVMGHGPAGSFVPISTSATANFSEPMDPASINTTTVELRGAAGAVVPAAVSYNAPSRIVTIDPIGTLEYGLTHTVVFKGGTTGPRVMDLAGNALAFNTTWQFTTAPAPTQNEGPGGPILVLWSSANPYSRYYAEILRAEGLNEFAVRDIAQVDAFELAGYDVAVLGEVPLTAAKVTMFSDWVNAGGHLLAMRPDKKLAGLLGLVDQASTISNGYLAVDGSTAPGAGIVTQPMQFHGPADGYALGGATSVATLYSGPSSATPLPAVTLNAVGVKGGSAATFTYDLARSIVYTRQGNPAWAGQERDGVTPITAADLFAGASTSDPQIDWVNLDQVDIPQADEQQRLLVNLILHMNRGRKPLPRFWYFPRGAKAVVVMTGDEHGGGGEVARFDGYKAASPAGCSVANWECVRATAYVSPSTPLGIVAAAGYVADGFEIVPQVDTGCASWTPASLPSLYADQLNAFAAAFPFLPAPKTHRARCSVWSDYATQPQVELTHGIRLDTNYSYGPDRWVMDRPGFFTGSGIPMRFADTTGALVDVYQAATQMTDASGQTYPFTVDALLDRAIGSEGYYGAFTANIHADVAYSPQSDQIVAAAKARGVPVIAARQLLAWLDGRSASSFQGLTWNGASLTFAVSVQSGTDATGLQAMLPASVAAGTLTALTLNGSPVAFTRQTIKGVEYGLFTVAAGTYRATYAP